MPCILTFDLGTTYFKACLFDGAGRLLSVSRAPTPSEQPQPGLVEIDPAAFQRTIVTLAQRLQQACPDDWPRVERVSFATQANSFLLLDANDHPLTPIIAWPDRRAESIVDATTSAVVTPDFYQQTGVAKFTAQFMPAKLHWLRTHQPAIWRQARRVCSISDFLTLWFTGEHVAEAGAAALTGLVNIHKLAWRREPIEQLHFNQLIFPTLARAGCPVGALRPDVADALKLPHKCQFTLGCLDQYAGAIGAGNVKPGGVSETTGTVLATVRLANYFDPNPAPDVFQGPAFQPSWHFRMIFGSVSANLLETFRRSHAPDHSYAELDAEAAVVPSHCDGLTLDTHASERANAPIFRNVTASHTRGHHIRAILETVAVTLAQQVHQLHPEGTPRMVRSVGGAATSDLWMQIKADELHTTMLTIDCAEPTSLGAAILAAATITNASVSDIAQQWVRTRSLHPTT